jgi:hypothetical protein
MAAEAEAKVFGGEERDETFLTDLMMGKKQQSERKARATPVPETDSEMNDQDIEDELRDVVFDYENSQALVLAADDFLAGRGAY